MNLCAINSLETRRVSDGPKLPTIRDDESRAHVLWVGAQSLENAAPSRCCSMPVEADKQQYDL